MAGLGLTGTAGPISLTDRRDRRRISETTRRSWYARYRRRDLGVDFDLLAGGPDGEGDDEADSGITETGIREAGLAFTPGRPRRTARFTDAVAKRTPPSSKVQLLLWLLLIFAGPLLLNGCAVRTVEKTAAGSYTVTVVATGGATSHNTNINLVVKDVIGVRKLQRTISLSGSISRVFVFLPCRRCTAKDKDYAEWVPMTANTPLVSTAGGFGVASSSPSPDPSRECHAARSQTPRLTGRSGGQSLSGRACSSLNLIWYTISTDICRFTVKLS